MSIQRTISDLPHFTVTAIQQLEARHEASHETALSGFFDRVRGISEGRGWLLLPERNALVGDIDHLVPSERTATFLCWEKPQPDLIQARLPFLDGYWQAYHVWMVAEPRWVWTRVLFRAQDAFAEKISDKDGKEWVKLSKMQAEDAPKSKSRYYSSIHDISSQGTVAAGWDHEHCELCWAHIDHEHFGYVDRGNHWVCETCYQNYVSKHDLAFLNEYWSDTP